MVCETVSFLRLRADMPTDPAPRHDPYAPPAPAKESPPTPTVSAEPSVPLADQWGKPPPGSKRPGLGNTEMAAIAVLVMIPLTVMVSRDHQDVDWIFPAGL